MRVCVYTYIMYVYMCVNVCVCVKEPPFLFNSWYSPPAPLWCGICGLSWRLRLSPIVPVVFVPLVGVGRNIGPFSKLKFTRCVCIR